VHRLSQRLLQPIYSDYSKYSWVMNE
jgi:hypothetical protein